MYKSLFQTKFIGIWKKGNNQTIIQIQTIRVLDVYVISSSASHGEKFLILTIIFGNLSFEHGACFYEKNFHQIVNCASLHEPTLKLSFKTALDVLFVLLRLLVVQLCQRLVVYLLTSYLFVGSVRMACRSTKTYLTSSIFVDRLID